MEKGDVPDEVYAAGARALRRAAADELTLQIVAINGWNRFCISFNADAGTYVPGSLRKTGRGPSGFSRLFH